MQIMKQLSIKGFVLPAIALCSLLLSGNAAHAALVTYSFTAVLVPSAGITVLHDEPHLSCVGVVSI